MTGGRGATALAAAKIAPLFPRELRPPRGHSSFAPTPMETQHKRKVDAMKTADTQSKTDQAKRDMALSPELKELVHMLDALEARFHERLQAVR